MPQVFVLKELREGQMRSCVVDGREIVVCHVKGGGVYALDNVCTHAMARMTEGRLRGTRLICPLHGASFDVRTGSVLGGPATEPLPVHFVRVVDGAVEVTLAASAAPTPPDTI